MEYIMGGSCSRHGKYEQYVKKVKLLIKHYAIKAYGVVDVYV
jgi:hypothetical protein